MLGSDTSIAFEIVGFVFSGLYIPDSKYSGTVLLIFVEAINNFIFNPISLLRIPAHILPKFPLGTEKILSFSLSIFFIAKK